MWWALIKTMEKHNMETGLEVKKRNRMMDNIVVGGIDAMINAIWYAPLAMLLTSLIGNGYTWVKERYVLYKSDQSFQDIPVTKNCEDQDGCRPGYESLITMEPMQKEGCCLDNQCYGVKELQDWIRLRNAEGYPPRLPHNNRPINENWLQQQCGGSGVMRWFTPAARHRRRAE
jgi:hypothetical protein